VENKRLVNDSLYNPYAELIIYNLKVYSLNYDFYGEVLKISLCNQKLGLQKKL